MLTSRIEEEGEMISDPTLIAVAWNCCSQKITCIAWFSDYPNHLNHRTQLLINEFCELLS